MGEGKVSIHNKGNKSEISSIHICKSAQFHLCIFFKKKNEMQFGACIFGKIKKISSTWYYQGCKKNEYFHIVLVRVNWPGLVEQ